MADDIRTAETRSSRTPWNRGKLTGPKPSIRPTSRRRGKAGQQRTSRQPTTRAIPASAPERASAQDNAGQVGDAREYCVRSR
jgi:hypothetical protein